VEERARRIVESAVELAEKGGFEAVRLRDVAAHANVALGTLYRRFRSKEDLLVAALEQQTAQLVGRVRKRPPQGEDELERVVAFFAMATRAMCRRPNLARACLKAAASGEPQLAQRVAAFHQHIEDLVIGALRNRFYDPESDGEERASRGESELARLFNQLWFSSLVAWSGGLSDETSIVEQMEMFGGIIFHGPQRGDAKASSR
jgi:AcrR family transcriptional regulator